MVRFGSDSPRDDREAIVLEAPPYTEIVCGNEVTHTDKVLVQYPGTSLDGGGLFGDMQENVSIEKVEPV